MSPYEKTFLDVWGSKWVRHRAILDKAVIFWRWTIVQVSFLKHEWNEMMYPSQQKLMVSLRYSIHSSFWAAALFFTSVGLLLLLTWGLRAIPSLWPPSSAPPVQETKDQMITASKTYKDPLTSQLRNHVFIRCWSATATVPHTCDSRVIFNFVKGFLVDAQKCDLKRRATAIVVTPWVREGNIQILTTVFPVLVSCSFWQGGVQLRQTHHLQKVRMQ